MASSLRWVLYSGHRCDLIGYDCYCHGNMAFVGVAQGFPPFVLTKTRLKNQTSDVKLGSGKSCEARVKSVG